jgi:uncharacterized NAD(P)/FAD-binding protein YdhS
VSCPHINDYFTVIIGGGFSGVAVACQLALRSGGGLPVAIVEQGTEIGKGRAFGTSAETHLLNVQAGRMSALPQQPDHFVQWLRKHHTPEAQATDFAPRKVYGRYIAGLLQETVARYGSIRCIRGEAVDLERHDAGYEVRLRSGERISARSVVLAAGYLGRNQPAILNGAGAAARSAWTADALQGIPRSGRVLTLGTGLTAIDQVLSLAEQGFEGQICMLSRHGFLPHSHSPSRQHAADWKRIATPSAREMLRRFRSEINKAAQEGGDWRGVVDSLRPVTQELWEQLPLREQVRFMRHLRTHWDVHRHRCAPQISQALERWKAEGRLSVIAGTLLETRVQSEGVRVVYRPRGTDRVCVEDFDRIINCAGFESSLSRVSHPLAQSLLSRGMATLGPHAMGLDVSRAGALVDKQGETSGEIFAIGPLRKGRAWETTAVPEIRAQAVEVAEAILAKANPLAVAEAAVERAREKATVET